METAVALALILFLLSGSLLFLTLAASLLHNPKPHFEAAIFIGDTPMSDTSIPTNGTATATAVITNNNVAVPGAIFDSEPSWSIADGSIASLSGNDLMSVVVTGLAAGVTTLSVSSTYLGNAVAGVAQVTITAVADSFAVDIQWAATPSTAGISRR